MGSPVSVKNKNRRANIAVVDDSIVSSNFASNFG